MVRTKEPAPLRQQPKRRQAREPKANSGQAKNSLLSFHSPETAYWFWAVIAVASLFLLFSYFESYERSYHIDELATIREGIRRVGDQNFQRQHGLFLDYHRWLSSYSLEPQWLRLPSIIASFFGILLTAAAAWRVSGPRVAFLVSAALLSIPLVWMNAVEIRFYGYMLFFGSLSLCGALAAGRGWVILGTLLTTIPAYLSYRFHPAGLPLHGMLFGIVMLATGRECWRAARGPYHRAWKWIVLGFGLLLLAATILATVRLAPEVQRVATSLANRSVNHDGERLREGWELSRIVRHSLSWSGKGPGQIWNWSSSFLLAALTITGSAWLLAQRRFLLAGALVAALLVHYAAAFWIGWTTNFAIKYLVSSLPVLALLCGLGAEAGYRLALRMPKAQMALAFLWVALLLIGFIFPAAYDTARSYARDPSNVGPIMKLIDEHTPEDVTPVLLAPSVLNELIDFQAQLGHNNSVKRHDRETHTTAIEHALILRPNTPFFKAEIAAWSITHIGGLPVEEAFELYGPFISSFSHHFSYNVWRLTAEPVLAPGMSGSLAEGKRVGFVEAGNWLIKAPGATSISIGGRDFKDGEELVINDATALDWQVKPEGTSVRLVPNYSGGAVRRSGVYANKSTISPYNRPFSERTRNEYRLTNNTNATYRFLFPEDPAVVVVESRGDLPIGGGFLAKFGDRVVGIYTPPNDAKKNQLIEHRIPVPEWARGGEENFSITFFGETHARRSDSDSVRVLPIIAIRIEEAEEEGEALNYLNEIPFAKYPSEWAPDGIVDMRRDDPESIWTVRRVNLEEENEVRMENTEDGLRFHLPEKVAMQAISLPLISLEEGEAIVFEVEARSHNAGRFTMVPLVYYFNEQFQMTHIGELSQLPIQRQDTGWTTRTGLATTPPGIKFGIFLLYLNVPEGEEVNLEGEDAWFEVRKLHFIAP